MIIRQFADRPNRAGRGAGLLAAITLAGCSSTPSSINPVSWWHDLQGGKIAEQRPPPPGATDAYPNLASVPGKPAAADPALRAGIANALIADRTAAQRVAAAAPLADPSSPSASPQLFGRGTASAPAPAAAAAGTGVSASLPTAEAPPPTRAAKAANDAAASVGAPAAAPRGAVASAPLAPPASPQSETAAAEDLPPLPSGPPPPAAVGPAGPSVRASLAPAPPPVSAPPPRPVTPVVAAAPSGPAVAIPFAPGSASVPAESVPVLKNLAAQRGAATIAVTGFGDAASSDPAVQSAAVTLGLTRAQAMAAVLASAGVPSTAVRVDAEAAGKGGAARLLN